MKSPTSRLLVGLLPVLASAAAVQLIPFEAGAHAPPTITRHCRVHLHMRRLPLAQQVAAADVIVRATITGVEKFVDPSDHKVRQRITAWIDESIVGGRSGALTFESLGGRCADVWTDVDFTPTFTVGDRSVLLLDETRYGLRLVGRSDGVYPISIDADGRPVVHGWNANGIGLAEFEGSIRAERAQPKSPNDTTEEGGR